jgi:hypothetical protein
MKAVMRLTDDARPSRFDMSDQMNVAAVKVEFEQRGRGQRGPSVKSDRLGAKSNEGSLQVQSNKEFADRWKNLCFNCGKPGHRVMDCTGPRSRDGPSNVESQAAIQAIDLADAEWEYAIG